MTTFSDAGHAVRSPSQAGSANLERRQSDRRHSEAAATAIVVSGDAFGRIHDLTVLDYSHEGMGVLGRETIEPGTEVSIGFAARGYVARRGTVLRCERCDEGYRIAIQLHARMAA